MRRFFLTACLLACAAIARAAAPAPSVPTCPDGHTAPIFTGHPFRPLACPPGGKETSRPRVSASSAAVASPDDGADLKRLDGEWQGLAYFGGARYEATLTVSDGGRAFLWHAMDYHTHIGLPMEARLKKPGWFSKGLPTVELVLPALPGGKLTGHAWLGAGAAAWQFDGRPELHRVQYSLAGDHLTATYTLFDPVLGPIASTLDLSRVPK
jgi:hypothetical protein